MSITTHEAGFSMTFANGLTISVAHGEGNYCDNRDGSLSGGWKIKTRTAEIIIWDNESKEFNFGRYVYDAVKGWLSADKIGLWISRVRAAEALDQLKECMKVEHGEEE